MRNKGLFFAVALLIGLVFLTFPNLIRAQNGHEQRIEKSISKRLNNHNLQKNGDIHVAIDGKNVVLSGIVSNIHQMNETEKQAGKAAKGYIIVNNLQVTQSSLTDQQLRDQVEKQLQKDVFYSIYDWVGFDVNNSVVTLAGWVREPWNMRQFEHAIQKVPGVIKINNQIKIESSTILDDEIRNQAANVIYNDPFNQPYASINGAPIHIVVNNGDVFLEGQVSRTNMRNWAANTVYMNTKALQVYNDIKVQG